MLAALYHYWLVGLTLAGKFLWRVVSLPFITLGKALFWASIRIGRGVSRLIRFFIRIGAASGRGVRRAIVILLQIVAQVVTLALVGLGWSIALPFKYLAKGLIATLRFMKESASRLFAKLHGWGLALGRPLKAGAITFLGHFKKTLTLSGILLWQVLSLPFVYLGKGLGRVVSMLGKGVSWLIRLLIGTASAGGRRTRRALTILLGFLSQSIAITARLVWIAVSTPFIYLWTGVSWMAQLSRRFASLFIMGLRKAGVSLWKPLAVSIRVVLKYLKQTLAVSVKFLWLCVIP